MLHLLIAELVSVDMVDARAQCANSNGRFNRAMKRPTLNVAERMDLKSRKLRRDLRMHDSEQKSDHVSMHRTRLQISSNKCFESFDHRDRVLSGSSCASSRKV